MSWARKVDATGRRFGRLIVLAYLPGTKSSGAHVRVRCDCGVIKTTWFRPLVIGVVVSCGCGKLEKTIARSTKHSACGTAEYRTWMAMKQRCLDPNAHNFKWYGGKGVAVCARWRKSFPSFLADMGKKPSPDHSIDRIDPFGDYRPGNCRWATRRQQARNKRMSAR